MDSPPQNCADPSPIMMRFCNAVLDIVLEIHVMGKLVWELISGIYVKDRIDLELCFATHVMDNIVL